MNIVITSINNRSYTEWARHGEVIVAGDKDRRVQAESARFLSFEEQEKRFPTLSRMIGPNTYSRKLFAYLEAKPGPVYETDDDNWPTSTWHVPRLESHVVTDLPYDPLHEFGLVSRGFPMHLSPGYTKTVTASESAGVSQHFCQGEPDCWALLRAGGAVHVGPVGAMNRPVLCRDFTVFNSQMTLWRNRCQAMYIPVTCPGRCGDILRSYAYTMLGGKVIHEGSGVEQKRNLHSFERDVAEEIPLLRHGHRLVNTRMHSLTDAYMLFKTFGIVKDHEIDVLREWLEVTKDWSVMP